MMAPLTVLFMPQSGYRPTNKLHRRPGDL